MVDLARGGELQLQNNLHVGGILLFEALAVAGHSLKHACDDCLELFLDHNMKFEELLRFE